MHLVKVNFVHFLIEIYDNLILIQYRIRRVWNFGKIKDTFVHFTIRRVSLFLLFFIFFILLFYYIYCFNCFIILIILFILLLLLIYLSVIFIYIIYFIFFIFLFFCVILLCILYFYYFVIFIFFIIFVSLILIISTCALRSNFYQLSKFCQKLPYIFGQNLTKNPSIFVFFNIF